MTPEQRGEFELFLYKLGDEDPVDAIGYMPGWVGAVFPGLSDAAYHLLAAASDFKIELRNACEAAGIEDY